MFGYRGGLYLSTTELEDEVLAIFKAYKERIVTLLRVRCLPLVGRRPVAVFTDMPSVLHSKLYSDKNTKWSDERPGACFAYEPWNEKEKEKRQVATDFAYHVVDNIIRHFYK